MFYTLVVIISLHWGSVPTTSTPVIIPHQTLSHCQAQAKNWVKWQNDLKTRMGNTGDVAVYPSCVAESDAPAWWTF